MHPTLRGVYSCSQDMIDAGECSELSDPYVNGIASTDFQALASEQADGIAPLRCRFSPLGAMGADIGDLFMDATLNADGNVECNTPPSAIPRDVSVEVSLNGQQYTNSPQMRDGAPLDPIPLPIFLSFAHSSACFVSPLCGSSWFCPNPSGRNRNIQSVAPPDALSLTDLRALPRLPSDRLRVQASSVSGCSSTTTTTLGRPPCWAAPQSVGPRPEAPRCGSSAKTLRTPTP